MDITGPTGPRVSGFPENAIVQDALVNGNWCISRLRTRHPTIVFLKDSLPPADTITQDRGDDVYLWAIGDKPPSSTFSTHKHAFHAWVTTLNRLHSRDRLITWGMEVPSTCLLCIAADETRQHLYFDCPYSHQVWSFFTSREYLPSYVFDDAVVWLTNPSPNKNMSFILKYSVSRLLLSPSISDIQNIIRCRLDPLSRAQRNKPNVTSYLSTWFTYFQS